MLSVCFNVLIIKKRICVFKYRFLLFVTDLYVIMEGWGVFPYVQALLRYGLHNKAKTYQLFIILLLSKTSRLVLNRHKNSKYTNLHPQKYLFPRKIRFINHTFIDFTTKKPAVLLLINDS